MSRLGFYLFAGLFGGALITNYFDWFPAVGAIMGAVLGAILAFYLDKKSGDQE